ncbi:DUF1911 domain-containing protein [Pelomonas sp. UHG3]|jgi:hypothetical protein|uniref:DUF1911 domain-containing protein n=1 Tax=Roseateles hydrophilus TaxID=2975054 RepID=A0ACC6C8S8_9BURK|nr:PoNe immunity protein domain-containing protein [Pelomonas sp. UHG3]MCY4744780.1 DUF1911 domain-containing protein [Pelomonas sp. UHG3]
MTSADALIRAPLGNPQYWRHWHQYRLGAIEKGWQIIAQSGANPSYEPQYLAVQAQRHWELMVFLYSAGAPIRDLAPWFDGLLHAWEQSQALEPSVYSPEVVHSRRTWSINFDLYGECMWLIGLALALEIPDAQWQRLLALIGNEGEDAVLDTLIASRQIGRRIGAKLLYPKPYARLHAAMTAPPQARPALLKDFVEHWYVELDRKATKGRPAIYNRLYWYKLGDENFEGGAYFGRWCIEAAAAAKAFGIDDALCCGLEHYPGDLLRPDGPSIHPQRHFAASAPPPWWKRWLSSR